MSRKLISYSKKRTRAFLELSKPELRRITGILTGHCALRHHLKKMGKTTDDTCRLCFEEKKTAKHKNKTKTLWERLHEPK